MTFDVLVILIRIHKLNRTTSARENHPGEEVFKVEKN